MSGVSFEPPPQFLDDDFVAYNIPFLIFLD